MFIIILHIKSLLTCIFLKCIFCPFFYWSFIQWLRMFSCSRTISLWFEYCVLYFFSLVSDFAFGAFHHDTFFLIFISSNLLVVYEVWDFTSSELLTVVRKNSPILSSHFLNLKSLLVSFWGNALIHKESDPFASCFKDSACTGFRTNTSSKIFLKFKENTFTEIKG